MIRHAPVESAGKTAPAAMGIALGVLAALIWGAYLATARAGASIAATR